VPIDWETPDGAQFVLPLIRRPASKPESRIGSLLVNPGGPGGSGVAWARIASTVLPSKILERLDIVGFDPRGVAASTPNIDCIEDLDSFVALDLAPEDDAEKQAIVDQSDAFVAGCEERSADILPFIGSDNVARDMDALREGLGDEKLTYAGFSYGTFIGATYAEMFPDKVRALVLDGALDPNLKGEEFVYGQAIGFESQLEAFLADCAANTACKFYSNGDPGAAYDAIQASIEAMPMPAGNGRVLGPGEFSYGVAGALYRNTRWPALAEALAAAAMGDASKLIDLSDGYTGRSGSGKYSNTLEVYYAVTSIDTVFTKDAATYDALVADLAVNAPRLGIYFPYTAFPSARWTVQAWRQPGPVVAEGAPPILVVGSTGDPATPHAWSVSLAEQLSSGVLLTREGDGHVAFLKGNDCIDRAIADYLVDLVVPQDKTVCK
jgi:pimeloyl-ACP methyl ester carboxylesterase